MPKNITYGPKPDEKKPEPSDTASKEIPHTNIDTPAFATASGDEITYVGGGNELCPRGLFDGTITGAVREPHPTEIWDNVIVTINAKTPIGPYDLRLRVPMRTGYMLQKLRLHSGETIEALRAEIAAGKERHVKFDLKKLVGRNVTVSVTDGQWEGRAFTRVNTVEK
jgi:hypothetical protein